MIKPNKHYTKAIIHTKALDDNTRKGTTINLHVDDVGSALISNDHKIRKFKQYIIHNYLQDLNKCAKYKQNLQYLSIYHCSYPRITNVCHRLFAATLEATVAKVKSKYFLTSCRHYHQS